MQLLERARGKVRIVNDSLTPAPGLWVVFTSPLFGKCVAGIREVVTDRILITDHGVLGTEEGMAIQPTWIQRVWRDDS